MRFERKLFTAGLVSMSLVSAVPATGAVISVGTSCSLADAIHAANTDLPVSGCPAGSGADQIVLFADVELATVDNDRYGPNGLPPITSEIVLRGNGHRVSRPAGAPDFRLFLVEETGSLTLDRTIVKGGQLLLRSGAGIANLGRTTLTHSTVSGNRMTGAFGAGIASGGLHARLALFHSSVSENEAVHDFRVGPSWGGGISNSAVLYMYRSAVSDNSGQGGGIYSYQGDNTLVRSTVSYNSSPKWPGGGIHAYHGSLNLVDSTVAYNDSRDGGGIDLLGSVAALSNSTVSGNTATGSHGDGGGIRFEDTALVVTNSTISGNLANGRGGGLYSKGDREHVSIENSTISANSAVTAWGGIGIPVGYAPISVLHTLIANNSPENCSPGPGFDDLGGNLTDDSTCGSIPGGLTGLETVLADNGGPTRTHALAPTSNAIGLAGDCGLQTDQRSAPRDQNRDSGAFEFGADDRFELSGEDSTDDHCFGHHLLFGRAERHLHSDEDWVWFEPAAGATYKIETGNLIGMSDTRIELWRNCDSLLATDDNGGEGLASRLIYTATAEDERFDLRIQQLKDEDAGAKGYDVTVTCLADCPPCPLPAGSDFSLISETIFGHRRIEACETISVSGSTRIATGGVGVLRAGGSVIVADGFEVHAGGTLRIEIERTQ